MQLFHGRAAVQLHTRKRPETSAASDQDRPLLLLHELGGHAATWSESVLDWPLGSVYAIDFAGHGQSGRLRGGAYYPEHFLADADLALEHFGVPCAVLGAGVGAYVATLLAGSRPDSVLGALLLDGVGLDGVGFDPESELAFADIEEFETFLAETSKSFSAGTDALVAQCAGDMRPLDYVASFAKAARPMLFSRCVGQNRVAPAWWTTAIEANQGLAGADELATGLRELAELVANVSQA